MDDNNCTYPDGSVRGFTDHEKRKWDTNIKRLHKRMAATCKHLVVGKPKKKKKKRKRQQMPATTSFDDCTCVRETDKALLVSIPDLVGDDVWIPKSVVFDEDSEVRDSDTRSTGTLVVFTWFAKQESWI